MISLRDKLIHSNFILNDTHCTQCNQGCARQGSDIMLSTHNIYKMLVLFKKRW